MVRYSKVALSVAVGRAVPLRQGALVSLSWARDCGGRLRVFMGVGSNDVRSLVYFGVHVILLMMLRNGGLTQKPNVN